jgi:hypothetical protein
MADDRLFSDDRRILAAAPLLWDAVLACRRHTHGLYLALTGHGEDAEARAWFTAYQALQALVDDADGR